ncbi:MAG TPA: tetratricopeptide repeat protein [Chthoniobacterales bacterium]
MAKYRVLICAPDDADLECERAGEAMARVEIDFKPRVELELWLWSSRWTENSKFPSARQFDLVACVLRRSSCVWGGERREPGMPLGLAQSLPSHENGKIPDFLVFVHAEGDAADSTSPMNQMVSPSKAVDLLLGKVDHRDFEWENNFTTSINSYRDYDQFETIFERLLRLRLGEKVPAEGPHAFPKGNALLEPDHFFSRFGNAASREVLSYINEWLAEVRAKWRRERRGVALTAFVSAATLATAITFGSVTFSRFQRSETNLAVARTEKTNAEKTARASMAAADKTARESIEAKLQSEQLMHEIVNDLGEKLKPVRRADLLEPSLKAIAAYDVKNGAGTQNGSVQVLRVAALNDQGDLLADDNNLDGAVNAYQEACRILEDLVKQEPAKDEWVAEWAQNLLKMGNIFSTQGKIGEAMENYQRAAGLWQKLASAKPAEVAPRSEWTKVLVRLGTTFMAQKDWAGARAPFEQARDILRGLADRDAQNPEAWLRVRQICNQLGDLEVKSGDLDRAVRAYADQLGADEKLAQLSPGDASEERDVAICQERIGYVLEAQGKMADALTYYEQELKGFENLLLRSSTDGGLRFDLSVAYESVGGVLREEGKPDLASPKLQKAVELAQQLLSQEASEKKYQRQLSVSLQNYGSVLADLDKTPAALQAYAQSQEICERLVAAAPGDTVYQQDLADCLGRVGDLYRADGNLAKARASYQRGLQISESLVSRDESNPVRRQQLALTFQRLAEATALSDKDQEALGYYKVSCDIFERLLETNGLNVTWQEFLANGYLQTGKILQQGGKTADATTQFNQSLKVLLSLRQINQLDDYGVSVLLGAEEALGKKFSADGGVVAELAQ